MWTTLRITIPRSCNMPGWLHFHVPEFSKLENRPTNDTDWLSWLMGWCGGSVILCEGFMTMHVCHCGPGGRWWRATPPPGSWLCMCVTVGLVGGGGGPPPGSWLCMCVTVGLVGGGGRPTNGFMTMHVCHCGPGGRWWQPTNGFMTMHAVTCRLTALYSVPQHSTYECGILPAFTLPNVKKHQVAADPQTKSTSWAMNFPVAWWMMIGWTYPLTCLN